MNNKAAQDSTVHFHMNATVQGPADHFAGSKAMSS